ncbi:sensor histidine kinase [Nocardioides mangrovi]|uniref:histidine kinase n=1 Tax=Nocardioides mangrovi TaxID=2874580 RepID=A0ABS7UDE4_9ACTN|nr:HAMP domain-containing sensor histidine kinase [Nocardioides mangrovi]MBZ5738885.1 HAMP domain-containing histidine kinase [Nocardioides mangrovi]
MRRLPLRVRLVAGFSVAMLVLLAAAGAFVYWRVEYALDRGLDTELAQATSTIVPLVGPDGAVDETAQADATSTAWQVIGADGDVLAHGGAAPVRPMLPASRLTGTDPTRTVDVGTMLPISGAPYRLRVTALDDPSGAHLVVGVRRDHRDEALRELLAQLTAAGVTALVIASLVGYALARAALAPVERYRRRAEEVAAGAADLRLDVPSGRDDEVTRLGHTLNDMLAALEESLERERRFVTDASHELRTPLTLLRSRIQLARRRTRTLAEHERVLDELAVDVERLADLAEQLLTLDRHAQEPGECDAASVVRSAVERWRLAEPEHAADVAVETTAGPATAIGPHALDRVVTNLLANARLHGAPPIRVRVDGAPGHTLLVVADAGPGMTPDLLAQATHRFARAAEARARPGAGLGLAIVEQLVIAAGGELRLCHDGSHHAVGDPTGVPCRHDGQMTVTVVLPTAGSR